MYVNHVKLTIILNFSKGCFYATPSFAQALHKGYDVQAFVMDLSPGRTPTRPDVSQATGGRSGSSSEAAAWEGSPEYPPL